MIDIIDYFRNNHAIEGLTTPIFIKWGGITLIWLIFAFLYQNQNKAFFEYIRSTKKRTLLNDRLSQLACSRAFEMLGIFFVLILSMIYYDTRLNKSEQDLRVAQGTITASTQKIDTLESSIEEKDQEITSATTSPKSLENMEKMLDTLKEKYEELFINYYYLKRCKAITPIEFHLMNSGLIQELTDLNAPAGIRKNILVAAKGTHDEMYINASCDKEIITPMQSNIQTYLQEVVKNLPDQ